jgi:hypothetical protein
MISPVTCILIMLSGLSGLQQKDPSQTRTLVIEGIFDRSGTRLLSSKTPVLYNRPIDNPTPTQKQGKFVIIVKWASGDSLEVPFDALIASDQQEGKVHGFFEVQIPVKTPIRWVAIRDKQRGVEFKRYNSILSR